MVNKVNFPHSPPSYMDINPYHKGPKNQGVEGTNLGPKPTFVDDMIMEEVRYLIHQAADNSVLPTSVLVNNSNIIKETISFKKIEGFFTHLNKTLGFITDYRSIIAS